MTTPTRPSDNISNLKMENKLRHAITVTRIPAKMRLTSVTSAERSDTMAQPHKGDRQQIATRIPRKDFNKLHRYVELTGTTKSDFLRDLVLERLASIDLDALNEDQTKLPLTA